MAQTVEVVCPWCGESQGLWVDRDTSGSMIQDCDVCCRPWQLQVHWEAEDDGTDTCVVFVDRA